MSGNKFKIHPAVWIPVLTALISAFTTIAVTYINAIYKANAHNNRVEYRQVSNPVAVSSSNTEARVRLSIKGFYMSTNK